MRVLFRADGGPEIGAGHVMRTMALAEQILGSGGTGTFACVGPLVSPAAALGLTIRRGSHSAGSTFDRSWTLELAQSADWVVLDSYAFDTDFQAAVASKCRLLFIDDQAHCSEYPASLVLNQNASYSMFNYQGLGKETELLLGPSYALLRSEFVGGEPEPVRSIASRILITMGGADPANATALVVRALKDLPGDWRARVILGPLKSDMMEEDPRIEWVRQPDMAECMRWADLAVAGAGITSYELCAVGVPSVLMVLAENQQEVAVALHEQGAAINAGWHHALDEVGLAKLIGNLCRDRHARCELRAKARTLVDGRGAQRVERAMQARLR